MVSSSELVRRVLPDQPFALQLRLAGIVAEIVASDRHDVAMEQAGVEQGRDGERHSARGFELVHVARTVGIDPRDQRHHRRQPVEILPIDQDAGGARNRRQVDRMVGRSSGCEQTDGGVDDRLLIDDAAERAIVVAVPADLDQPVNRCAGQLLAKLGAGVDEGGAGNVQSHHLHHHLVRIGGAVEGAGASPMIGGGLGVEQLRAANLALGIKLADAPLLFVGEPRRHRPGRHEDRRQMAEAQRPDQSPGTILSQMPSSAAASNMP